MPLITPLSLALSHKGRGDSLAQLRYGKQGHTTLKRRFPLLHKGRGDYATSLREVGSHNAKVSVPFAPWRGYYYGGLCPLMMPIFKSSSPHIFEKDPETSSG